MARPKPLTVVVAAAVILLVGAGLTAVRWHRAENDSGLDRAHARDTVLVRAQDAAVQMSTLDYRSPDKASASWKRVATGDLYKSLVDGKNDYQQLIVAGKVITTAKTTGSAVQSLAEGNAHAVVLVGLDVTVTPAEGQPSVEHERLVLTMTHTPTGWKAAAMEPVASS